MSIFNKSRLSGFPLMRVENRIQVRLAKTRIHSTKYLIVTVIVIHVESCNLHIIYYGEILSSVTVFIRTKCYNVCS